MSSYDFILKYCFLFLLFIFFGFIWLHIFYFIGKIINEWKDFKKEPLSIGLSIIFILIIKDAWHRYSGDYFEYFSIGLGGVIGLNLLSLPKFFLYIFEIIYITYLKLFSNNIILKEFQKQKEIKIKRQEFNQKQREYQKKIEKEVNKMSQIDEEIEIKKRELEELQSKYSDILPQETLPSEKEMLLEAIKSYQGYLGELKKRFITEQVKKTIIKAEELLKEINQLGSLGTEHYKLLTEYQRAKASYNPERIKEEVEREWSLKNIKNQKEIEAIELERAKIEKQIKELRDVKQQKPKESEITQIKKTLEPIKWWIKEKQRLKKEGFSEEQIDEIERNLYEKGAL